MDIDPYNSGWSGRSRHVLPATGSDTIPSGRIGRFVREFRARQRHPTVGDRTGLAAAPERCHHSPTGPLASLRPRVVGSSCPSYVRSGLSCCTVALSSSTRTIRSSRLPVPIHCSPTSRADTCLHHRGAQATVNGPPFTDRAAEHDVGPHHPGGTLSRSTSVLADNANRRNRARHRDRGEGNIETCNLRIMSHSLAISMHFARCRLVSRTASDQALCD